MPYTIRQATLDDAAALADIIIQSNQAAFSGIVPDQCLTGLTWEESRTNWLHFLQTERTEDAEFLYVATNRRRLFIIG